MTTSNDLACMLIVINFFLSEKIDITVSHHLSISEPIRRAKRLKRIKLKMVVYFMRILYPYAQNIVAVSNGVADDLSYTSRTDRKRIATIYNPIVSKTFASKISEGVIEQSSFKNSLPTVIFVGRICPVKRIDIILAAIEKVILKTPVDLLIVGDGPDINDLEKQIREKCLQEFCVLTGFVENPLPLIAASDVLVLTSDYEGFGNVLVEAMACGTQVISTKCPYGPEEILGDNQFGQLIPTDDSDALVSAILNVVEGRFLVEKSVLESRAMDFSVELAVSKYLDIFEKRI